MLRDQYRFAGAGQTGRMSSRGAQIQNLTRDVLGEDGAAEAALVDAIADGCSYAALAAAEPARRAGGAQARAARASRHHCRAGESVRVVGLAAIEARVTPWLAASEGAEQVLDIFRANDADPTRPDIYTLAAADILHKDPSAITKTERSIGKVAVLALGFGGSVGALQRMALSYRIHLDDAEARRIVDAWREANPWAREFWGAHRDGESFGLWGAAMRAWEMPGEITAAGRLAFIYRDGLSRRHLVHGAAVGPPADLSATNAGATSTFSTRTASRPARNAASCRFGARTGAPSYGTARSARMRSRPPPPTFCARPSPGSRPIRRLRSCRSA